jgi:hypothetical protein
MDVVIKSYENESSEATNLVPPVAGYIGQLS